MSKKNNIISLPQIITNLTLIKLTEEVDNLKKQHRKTCEMAVKSILHALDCKDHYTFGHSMRVAFFSVTLGKELKLNNEEMYLLEMSALCHDIGKIAVPDSVLNKPARLTEEEFLIMKSHPSKSAEILKDFTHLQDIAKFAKHHHERYDGRGYPDGLKAEDIPLFSRIILIADTFDAMTSTRPYRKGLSYQIAFEELSEFSGSQFDPELVQHFISAMEKEEKRKKNEFFLELMGEYYQKAA